MVRCGHEDLASLAVVAALATAATTQAGCYGSYSAFRAVHRWNGTVSSNAIVKSAIHLGLWIVPVYELTIAGDWLIFNTVEFITNKPVFK